MVWGVLPKAAVVCRLVFPRAARKTRLQLPAAECVRAVFGAAWRMQRIVVMQLVYALDVWPRACLALPAERKALNLLVVGSSSTEGVRVGRCASIVSCFGSGCDHGNTGDWAQRLPHAKRM